MKAVNRIFYMDLERCMFILLGVFVGCGLESSMFIADIAYSIKAHG